MELQIEEIKELVMKLLKENNAEYLSDNDKVDEVIRYVIDNTKRYSEGIHDKHNYSSLIISIPMYNNGIPMLFKVPHNIDIITGEDVFPSINSVLLIPSIKEKKDSPIKIIIPD